MMRMLSLALKTREVSCLLIILSLVLRNLGAFHLKKNMCATLSLVVVKISTKSCWLSGGRPVGMRQWACLS